MAKIPLLPLGLSGFGATLINNKDFFTKSIDKSYFTVYYYDIKMISQSRGIPTAKE